MHETSVAAACCQVRRAWMRPCISTYESVASDDDTAWETVAYMYIVVFMHGGVRRDTPDWRSQQVGQQKASTVKARLQTRNHH